MQIKDLAIGDGFVYLMEDDAKVKFYVLAHNYESVLNGRGRTMFCRESPATSGTHTTSKKDDYRVNSNDEDTWYKNTYVNKFSNEVRNLIGSTKYAGQYAYYYSHPGIGVSGGTALSSETYESSFFPFRQRKSGAQASPMALRFPQPRSAGSATFETATEAVSGREVQIRALRILTNRIFRRAITTQAAYTYLPQAVPVFRFPMELTAVVTATCPASPCRRRCTSTKMASPRKTSRLK